MFISIKEILCFEMIYDSNEDKIFSEKDWVDVVYNRVLNEIGGR